MPCRGIITNLTANHLRVGSALAACDAVLTGPYVAAAAGTPVIVPFGSTSPDLTGLAFPMIQILPHQLADHRRLFAVFPSQMPH